jgi:hypothetical protein
MKKLESKPDQKTFFQLIWRNHAEVPEMAGFKIS